MINWKKLEFRTNALLIQIPSEECLCINEAGEMLIGYLNKNKYELSFFCESEESQLEDVVAYIPCSELKMIHNLQTSIPE